MCIRKLFLVYWTIFGKAIKIYCMRKTTKTIFILLVIVAVIFLFQNIFAKNKESAAKVEENPVKIEDTTKIEEKKDRIVKIEIIENSTYGELMRNAGVDYAEAMKIYELAKDKYDLVKIRLGRFLNLTFDKDTDEFKRLQYAIDTEEEIVIEKNLASSTWDVVKKNIDYNVVQKTVEGEVESSMYQAAIDNDIDIRAIIELANAFQWSIDFAMDPRVGDKFKFVYEERYLDGEYQMPGKILAGKYINDGTEFTVYYFEESENNKGYFDQDGNSVQKMFLKAPVEFKYISSGFTTGLRYVEAFNVSTGHRAVDYAAALGTPIRAVGDGTVTYAGWNSSGYGNLTSIRHNSTYSTNYGHQSKISVRVGQKIKQGQIIGYVGSTGFSTGPHLHYEMLKNGSKINPLKEVLPPGNPIKDENKERFFMEITAYSDLLK